MIAEHTIEKFADGDTVLHRLDPRVKIVCTVILSVVVAVTYDTRILILALVFGVLLVSVARLGAVPVLKRLLIANFFIFFLWLTLPFTTPGPALVRLGPLAVTLAGVERALLITVKTNAILITCIALLNTSRLRDLAHAALHLRVPKKLVLILFFCVRYIDVILAEYHRLVQAMKSRAFVPRADMRTYRAYAHLVGALLVRSYDRAERIYQAMLSRGFEGKFRLFSHFKLKPVDCALGAALLCFTAVLGLLQWAAWKY